LKRGEKKKRRTQFRHVSTAFLLLVRRVLIVVLLDVLFKARRLAVVEVFLVEIKRVDNGTDFCAGTVCSYAGREAYGRHGRGS
jgi:hypothetical protein